MLTLMLMRHAKSDWSAGAGGDRDRPLNKRGTRAAGRMGRWLATAAPPAAILTSPAVRATRTVEIAVDAGPLEADVGTDDRIYEASALELLKVVRGLGEAPSPCMLVGHEPGMSGLIDLLTGARVRFPTAAIAAIDLDVELWEQVSPDGGTLRWLVVPRLLDPADSG